MKKVVLLFLVITLIACDIPYIKNEWESDKLSSFDYLHTEIENHYVFTELKELNLDSLKSSYRTQISNDMSDEDYFTILSEYMNELKDGHANILAPFAKSSSYYHITGYEEDDYNPNYNQRLIRLNYLQDDDILGASLLNGIIYRDDKSYGYIYYSSFMDSITTYEIEFILDRFSSIGVDGIILDIRSNGGGSLLNTITMVSYFGYDDDNKTKEVVKTWRRDGKDSYTKVDALDFTLGFEVSFHVSRNKNAYTGPVALLTNRGSYSASSFAATAFKMYDNVRQFGDDTGGGMGLPIGGTMPNGWKYRFSSNVTMDARAESYTEIEYNYENGVPADEKVIDDPETDTVDEIIEAAITWIDVY